MKKRVAVIVRFLIVAGLAVIIGVGSLFYKEFSRTWGGYSFFEVYRDDGTLEKEVCYKDGEFVRVTREYSEEGVLEIEAFNDGSYREYYKNGNIKDEIIKDKRNFKIYTIKTYYENGKVDSKQVYWGAKLLDKNKKPFNGVYKYYYQNGNIRKEETYKNGKMNGPLKEYYKNGNLKFEFMTTERNRYVSGKSYYEGGQIESNIEQRLEGPVMVKYNLSGELTSEHNMF